MRKFYHALEMNDFHSKEISFSKFHGAGNDFVMIDCMNGGCTFSQEEIAALCDRKTGIGADGLIIIEPSQTLDFKMRYYNCDGRESTFCGNGGRCVAAFAHRLGLIEDECTYEGIDGIHHATINVSSATEYFVRLSMRDVEKYDFDGTRLIINTGSPHYVTIVDNLNDFDVNREGARIRYDKNISEDGVNVDFLEFSEGMTRIRTYERGVENETLACGTGVTAAAMATSLWKGGENIDIETSICTLNVRFDRDGQAFKNVVLSGPATFVFDGLFILKEKNGDVRP